MKQSNVGCEYGTTGHCVELSNGKDLCSFLPNCGCGDPESTMRHYHRTLAACEVDRWGELDRESDLDQLLLYVLDHFLLIEHGTTVWYSWRTELGNEVLAAMLEHWGFLERPEREGSR